MRSPASGPTPGAALRRREAAEQRQSSAATNSADILAAAVRRPDVGERRPGAAGPRLQTLMSCDKAVAKPGTDWCCCRERKRSLPRR